MTRVEEEVFTILGKAEKPLTCPEVVRRLQERGMAALVCDTLLALESLILDEKAYGWVDRRNTVYVKALPLPPGGEAA